MSRKRKPQPKRRPRKDPPYVEPRPQPLEDPTIAEDPERVEALAVTQAILDVTGPIVAKRRVISGPMAPGKVWITIAVAGGAGTTLEHEISLVKSALLYADRVTLCSPRAAMLGATQALHELTTAQQVNLMTKLGPHFGPPAQQAKVRDFKKLLALPHKSLQHNQQVKTLERAMAPVWDDVKRTVDGVLREAGAGELTPAIEAGVLDLTPLEEGFASTNLLMDLFLKNLAGYLHDTSTYILLDELATDLVRTGQAAGFFAAPGKVVEDRMGQAKLGTGLVGMLPTFPEAQTDDLLKVRQELAEPMIRFRRAVARLRGSIETGALDPDFGADVRAIYETEVRPAVSDIESLLESRTTVPGVLKLGAPGGGFLAMLLFHASDFKTLLAAGIGASVATAVGAADLRSKQADREREAESNDLFFLYQSNRLLEGERSIVLW